MRGVLSDPAVCAEGRTKRQQILDAAYQVFSRKGFHRATVDEIVALADTGKGTVYNYFVNKERLFYILVRERSAPFEAALAEVAAGPEDSPTKLRKIIRLFTKFFVDNADLWRVMIHEMRGVGAEGHSKLAPQQREKYREDMVRIVGDVEKVIRDGLAKGAFAGCDPKIAAYSLLSVVLMMAFQGFVGDDPEAAAERVADMFLHGITKRDPG